jgi:WD40 repeat protein
VELKLWDLVSGIERDSLALPGDRLIVDLAFAPDGGTVAACGENHATGHAVVLWDLRSRRTHELSELAQATWYPALAVSPNGHTLAVGCGHGQGAYPGDATGPKWGAIQLFDLATGKRTAKLTGHAAVVQWVAWTADGKTLVSADFEAMVKVWDVATGQARFSVRAGTHMALSPDGNTLATVQPPGDLLLWDMATGRRLARIGSVPSPVQSLRFGPTGTRLAVACADGTVRLFDVRAVHDLPGHRPAEAWAVAFAPDGKTLATAGDDHTIRQWSVPDFQQQRVLRGHDSLVSCVAFSPDGRTLASGSFEPTVRLWDVATGQSQMVLDGHTQPVRAVAFSPDGRTLATAAKCVDEAIGELRLWDVSTGEARIALAAQGNCLAFSRDGRLLAFRGAKDAVELLDVATLQRAGVLRGSTAVSCVIFAPADKTLATADTAGLLRFWDAATGLELTGQRAWTGSDVRALAYSPDGKTLASASKDKTIRLWQAASRLELLRLKNLPDYAHAVVFSPDSTTLAAACHDGTVRLYQGKRGE